MIGGICAVIIRVVMIGEYSIDRDHRMIIIPYCKQVFLCVIMFLWGRWLCGEVVLL